MGEFIRSSLTKKLLKSTHQKGITMKIKLKNNKGIAGTDALIALLIITLFSGLIATFSYNIYLSNASIKRMSKDKEYIVDVFEYIDRIDYEELDLENNTNSIIEKYNYLEISEDPDTPDEANLERMWKLEGEPENGFNIIIILDKYKPNDNAEDLVRKITMSVNYKLGNRDQTIEMTRIKQIERSNLTI